MTKEFDEVRSWRGNIDEFAKKTREVMQGLERPEAIPPSTRLIRDYIQRGLLGDVPKEGKELVFSHVHLARFAATRSLRSSGWNLQNIAEYIEDSSPEVIEAFLQQGSGSASPHLRDGIARSAIQAELHDALQRLGVSGKGVPTEAMTLIAVAPWFQALVQTDRLVRVTPEEAIEIGRTVTAVLFKLSRATQRR
ncbi:MAG: MerR family transcriptional regulator [Verrucomicrobiaceae bacterium]